MTKFDRLSAAGYQPENLVFKRQHTGDAPAPTQRLRPLWPHAAAALLLIGIGGQLIVAAPQAPFALFGLGVCLVGLALGAWVVVKMQPKADAP